MTTQYDDDNVSSQIHHRTQEFIVNYDMGEVKFKSLAYAKTMLSAVIGFYVSNRLDRFPTEVEDIIVFMGSMIKELGKDRVRDMLHDDPFHSIQVFDIVTDDPKTPGGKSSLWHIDIDDKICLEFNVDPIPSVE